MDTVLNQAKVSLGQKKVCLPPLLKCKSAHQVLPKTATHIVYGKNAAECDSEVLTCAGGGQVSSSLPLKIMCQSLKIEPDWAEQTSRRVLMALASDMFLPNC